MGRGQTGASKGRFTKADPLWAPGAWSLWDLGGHVVEGTPGEPPPGSFGECLGAEVLPHCGEAFRAQRRSSGRQRPGQGASPAGVILGGGLRASAAEAVEELGG